MNKTKTKQTLQIVIVFCVLMIYTQLASAQVITLSCDKSILEVISVVDTTKIIQTDTVTINPESDCTFQMILGEGVVFGDSSDCNVAMRFKATLPGNSCPINQSSICIPSEVDGQLNFLANIPNVLRIDLITQNAVIDQISMDYLRNPDYPVENAGADSLAVGVVRNGVITETFTFYNDFSLSTATLVFSDPLLPTDRNALWVLPFDSYPSVRYRKIIYDIGNFEIISSCMKEPSCRVTRSSIVDYEERVSCSDDDIMEITVRDSTECGTVSLRYVRVLRKDIDAPVVDIRVVDTLKYSCFEPNIDDLSWPTFVDDCSDIEIDYWVDTSYLSCLTIFVRHWIAYDDCGNASLEERQTIIGDRRQSDAFVKFISQDTVLYCVDDIPELQFTIEGFCGYEHDVETTILPFRCETIYVQTLVVSSECGGIQEFIRRVTVKDTVSFTLTIEDDETLECVLPSRQPSFTVNAEGCSTIDTIIGVSMTGGGCVDSITTTVTVTSGCGESKSVSNLRVVEKKSSIMSISLQDTLYIECGDEIPPFKYTTEISGCDQVDTIFGESSFIDGCEGRIVIRSVRLQSACSGFVSRNQIVIELRHDKLDVSFPDTIKSICLDDEPYPQFTVEFSGCGYVDTSDIVSSIVLDELCVKQTLFEFTVSTDCGDTISVVQIYEQRDTIPPVIICPEQEELVIYLPASVCDTSIVLDNILVFDNCRMRMVMVNGLEYEMGDPISLFPGSNDIEIQAFDMCGNFAICTRNYRVEREEPPVEIVCKTYYFDCLDQLPPKGDDVVEESQSQQGCQLTVYRSKNIPIVCSDSLVVCVDTFVVARADVQPPTIIQCLDPVTITSDEDCYGNWTISSIQVTDECGISSIVVSIAGGSYSVGQSVKLPVGRHDVRYTITDKCGNSSTCRSTVTVKEYVSNVHVQCLQDALNITLNDECIYFEINQDNIFRYVSWEIGCCEDFDITIRRSGNYPISDNVILCCDDIGSAVTIRVDITENCTGKTDYCTFVIRVEDKNPPQIIQCPEDVEIPCDEFDGDLSQFGVPIFDDECGNITIVDSTYGKLDWCGTGTLVRSWYAFDAMNNVSSLCTQTITVTPNFDSLFENIVWPKPYVTWECVDIEDLHPHNLSPEYSKPLLPTYQSCHVYYTYFKDQVFDFDKYGKCQTILRKWTVEEECSGKDTTFIQTLSIMDNVPPVFTYVPSDTLLCVFDDLCGSIVSIHGIIAEDDCHGPVRIEVVGNNDFYELGTHEIPIIATDRCGNRTDTVVVVTITDCKNPGIVCINSVSTTLMDVPGGMVEIWAKDFVISVSDNCTDATYLWSHISFSPDSLVMNRSFSCEHLGSNDMSIYVSDRFGNTESCQVTLRIQDNLNDVCEDVEYYSISGNVSSYGGDFAFQPSAELVEFASTVVSPDGSYLFDVITQGGDYQLSVSYTDELVDNVSVLDLILIQQYILGLNSLDDQFMMIAADVNKDRVVSAHDLIILRRYLLTGQEPPEWLCVVDELLESWSEYRTSLDFNHLSQDYEDQNFVCVRVGNVNAYEATIRSSQEVFLTIRYVDGGIEISREDNKQFLALDLQLTGIDGENQLFDYYSLVDNELRVVYVSNDMKPITHLFVPVQVKSSSTIHLGEIHIIFDEELNELNARLFNNNHSIYVYPNPTCSIVYIKGLIDNQKVSLFDYSGKQIDISERLKNNQLDLDDLPKGMYFLKTDQQLVTIAKPY